MSLNRKKVHTQKQEKKESVKKKTTDSCPPTFDVNLSRAGHNLCFGATGVSLQPPPHRGGHTHQYKKTTRDISHPPPPPPPPKRNSLLFCVILGPKAYYVCVCDKVVCEPKRNKKKTPGCFVVYAV